MPLMNLQETLSNQVKKAVKTIFNADLDMVEFQATRKDFAGDLTVVVFPILKVVKGNPQSIGEQIGDFLVANVEEVKAYNVIKGFLNIEIEDTFYINFFNEIKTDDTFGFVNPKPHDKAIMVEYSSPNTNKPLHLGHIRNNLLGYSVAEIIKASGKKVYKTQIINDRGIHICKSMLAWKRFGKGETPESTGLKGDKLVGNYYVKFNQEYKKEIKELVNQGKTEEEAKKQAPILLEAQNMLQKWEAGNPETVALWNMMNAWVYEGFVETYKNLGVDFDQLYYESQTYLLGKEFVAEGLKKDVFVKKEDGSVWCDLTEDGLDEKIVLRSDGTAVYMTQDIGTAIQRVKDYPEPTATTSRSPVVASSASTRPPGRSSGCGSTPTGAGSGSGGGC
jgi:arginyl-tRNA synthetase